jgi:TPP-dependent pyruvate/acetoin dehydrogenase alpha subunit
MMDTNQFPHNPLKFERLALSDTEIRHLYSQILLPRLIEEKMLSQLRQGHFRGCRSGS